MALVDVCLKARNLMLTVLYVQLIGLSLIIVSAQPPGNDTKCKAVPGQPGCVCDHPFGRIDLTPTADRYGKPK